MNYTDKLMILNGGEQIPGSRSPWRPNCVLWLIIYVDPQDETCFVRCSFFWDVTQSRIAVSLLNVTGDAFLQVQNFQTPNTVCSASHQLLVARLSVLITVTYVIAPGFM
jgi:hypothetical protein